MPTPPNLISQASLTDSTGAEALRAGAISDLSRALHVYAGIIEWSAILSDEVRMELNTARNDIAVDARSIAIGDNGRTSVDGPYTALQAARVLALQAAGALERYPTHTAQTEIAELFALAGYSEVILDEIMCPGVPLSEPGPTGGIVYGDPLSTDSLAGSALGLFDSATAHVGSDPTIGSLVAVGRGRALLDRGRFAAAGAAVSGVPLPFMYGTRMATAGGQGFYQDWGGGPDHPAWTVGDRKGQTGLDFVSAHDPRLVTINEGTTYVGLTNYYPVKFPPTSTADDSVPLADGVEAQLMVAEAALSNGAVGTWLATLNQLRANFTAVRGAYPADTSYHQLDPLADPGSDSARVNLTFRERAFWLYGTVHRLGDLRRLVRQYGRDQSTVFPSGPYDNGSATAFFSSYGSSVNFPMGAIEAGNPKFHGCSSTAA